MWMLWDQAGGPDPGRKQELAQSASVLVDWTEKPPPGASFPGPADFSDIGSGVGLGVQDAHDDFVFRSGSFPNTLPTDPIEIVAGPRTFFQKDIQGLLPTLPMQVDSQTSLTSLIARLADADRTNNLKAGIDFIAKGSTCSRPIEAWRAGCLR